MPLSFSQLGALLSASNLMSYRRLSAIPILLDFKDMIQDAPIGGNTLSLVHEREMPCVKLKTCYATYLLDEEIQENADKDAEIIRIRQDSYMLEKKLTWWKQQLPLRRPKLSPATVPLPLRNFGNPGEDGYDRAVDVAVFIIKRETDKLQLAVLERQDLRAFQDTLHKTYALIGGMYAQETTASIPQQISLKFLEKSISTDLKTKDKDAYTALENIAQNICPVKKEDGEPLLFMNGVDHRATAEAANLTKIHTLLLNHEVHQILQQQGIQFIQVSEFLNHAWGGQGEMIVQTAEALASSAASPDQQEIASRLTGEVNAYLFSTEFLHKLTLFAQHLLDEVLDHITYLSTKDVFSFDREKMSSLQVDLKKLQADHSPLQALSLLLAHAEMMMYAEPVLNVSYPEALRAGVSVRHALEAMLRHCDQI